MNATPATTRAALVVAGCAALLAAGCGGGGTATPEGPATGSAPSASPNSALAQQVPQAIASDGIITVGTDATYAPNEFLAADGRTVEGFDVDLFNAVAQKLGLEADYVSAPFDSIIPSVQSGKYEVGVSSFSINPEREQVADMVSYFSAGTQWATKKGNPADVDPDNACGKRVAVQRGTVQVPDVTARSQQCTGSGQPAIAVDQFQGQDQTTAAVVSGKDDAMLADSPVAAYAVKQTNGQLETLGAVYDSAPYGYVVKKGQGEFPAALQGAVNELIQDGTYAAVVDRWGVSQGAIPQSQVNP
jgi:polar amino acid transport system substrate-binding protein